MAADLDWWDWHRQAIAIAGIFLSFSWLDPHTPPVTHTHTHTHTQANTLWLQVSHMESAQVIHIFLLKELSGHHVKVF